MEPMKVKQKQSTLIENGWNMIPINKQASLGMTRGSNNTQQEISPLPYHKFKALAKSKRYRDRTLGLTHSQRMDLLAIELGGKSFSHYKKVMLGLGFWKFKNGEQRCLN